MNETSDRRAPTPGRNLAYRAASDSHWITTGSTAPDMGELAHRRPTRTSPGQPLNLTVYDLALDHDASLEDFARTHGRPGHVPTGRTALAAYAAAIATQQPEAAAEYEIRQLASSLKVALTLGDSDDALGGITCPKCLCWSLVPSRGKGGWRAECRNLRCAHDPDPVHDQGDTEPPTASRPRWWTIERIAAHHLADCYAMTA